MNAKKILGPLTSLSIALLLSGVGCSGSTSPAQGSGGSVGSGGATSSGGTSSNSGGNTGSGGASSAGGSDKSGGAPGSGGVTGSGGAAKSGGATGSGGTATGGAATGGAATGGASTAAGGGPGGRDGGPASGGSTGSGGGAGGGSGTADSGASGGGSGSSGCPAVAGLDSATFDKGKSPSEIGKLGTDYFIKSQLQSGLDNYGGDGYAWTFGWVGSLLFTQTVADSTTNKTLTTKLDCSTFKAPTGTDVDQRAFGDLPLEIFRQNGNTACKTLGLSLADAQWANTTSDGITTEARYWIDDMYMITGLQVWAYRATKDQKYLDRAAKTMVAYIGQLQKDNDTKTTGLFWHTKKSHAYWSRANGWFASGATELLLDLPGDHTNRAAIMTAWKKQIDALITLQFPSGSSDEGCWHQVLDVTTDAKSYAESSSSAMFTFALVTGLKNGWISGDKYVAAALSGWKCIANKTDSTGLLTKVCEGTGEPTATDLAGQQAYYFSRATPAGDRHGQGPLLWAANALLRKDCPGVR